jgi:hypothetical protein
MPEPTEQDRKPLIPCRGCTADCPDLERCGGRLWRVPREQTGADGSAVAGESG